ncbi:MAG: DNA translocase FtsK [Candidatus Levybacteria bacterium]|nr:DNA translocase FtsK [Candidatus Levybacteria bacterium]
MPGKRSSRRKPLKLKLKKKTVYNIFSLGFFIAGILFLVALINQDESTLVANTRLNEMFGALAIMFPFVLFFFGFLFLRLKMYFSQLNVTVGYMLVFVSLIGLTRSGTVGTEIYTILQEIITPAGANLVFIGGLLVGILVFFDTSIDEVLGAVGGIKDGMGRLIPRTLFASSNKDEKPLMAKGKVLTIKGGQKEDAPAPFKENSPPPPQPMPKKDPEVLPERLLTNMPAGGAMGVWEYPSPSLLSDDPGKKAERGDVKKTAAKIESTLQSFGIDTRVAEANLGPAVTQYALELALGTKVSKITSLANDLALATEAPTGQIRIEAPIPGRNLIGIEIPNRSLEVVTLKSMLTSTVMQKSKSKLVVSLGLDVSGNPMAVDIARMPHVLVAGTTGSGKSVLINAFIASILFRASPQEVRLIMIDPKRVEFTMYNGIPHLLTPVIVDQAKILSALKWAMNEMDKRYKIFAERGVRNIDGYNELSGFQALPYIVVFIDELADLMMFAPVEVEDAIARLAQMARATGIHLVIATQRPSVNVITGLIKANIPCRIAFNVSSMIDSRVIIDSVGAEKLLGRGDMLYIPPDQAKPSRIQGTFVSEKEIRKLVDFLKSKNYPVEYTEEVISQPLPMKGATGKGSSSGADGRDGQIDEAIRLVMQFDTASASFLQRKMSVGYARAARIMDQLEEMGIIGQADGAKPRDVLRQNAQDYLAGNQEQEQA